MCNSGISGEVFSTALVLQKSCKNRLAKIQLFFLLHVNDVNELSY